jgi:hypothetical protein
MLTRSLLGEGGEGGEEEPETETSILQDAAAGYASKGNASRQEGSQLGLSAAMSRCVLRMNRRMNECILSSEPNHHA